MGLIIPAMIIRISRGHTGRKVAFDAVDKGVLWIMILALLLRVARRNLPRRLPAVGRPRRDLLVHPLSPSWPGASCPMLLQPRIDGREH
jgi:uncharacterized protein involved in response to NO